MFLIISSYLLKVSFSLLFFYGFYYFFLRKENFFSLNRIYLVSTSIFSFIIPWIQIDMGSKKTTEVAGYIIGMDELFVEGVSTMIRDQNTFLKMLTLENVLASIYFLGLAFLFLKFLVGISQLVRLIFKSSIKKENGFYLVNIQSNLPVFSFFNFIFWSEDNAYSPEETKQIILHEQVHINQKHSLDIILMECLTILLWFNPFIYLYKRSLKNTHEFIADYHLYEKQQYQLSYVDLLMKEASTKRKNILPVVHPFFNNQLKKRLIMIKNSNRSSSKIKFLGSLPIFAMLLLFFSIEPAASAQNELAENKSPHSGTIYVVVDADNDFTIKDDGSRRNKEEIKNYIVDKNAKEGKTVDPTKIHLISKEEMNRNLGASSKPEKAKRDGSYRLTYTESGTLLVHEKNGDQLTPLKIISFTADINKVRCGSTETGLTYDAMNLEYEGNKLNSAAKDFINSIADKNLKHSYITFSNILVEIDGKEELLDLKSTVYLAQK